MTSNIEDYLSNDVVVILKGLFETGKALHDYKLVGNSFGITVILRLTDPAMTSTPRFSSGKSPARQARDNFRRHQYASEQQGLMWSSSDVSNIERSDYRGHGHSSKDMCTAVNTVDIGNDQNKPHALSHDQCTKKSSLSVNAETFTPKSQTSISLMPAAGDKLQVENTTPVIDECTVKDAKDRQSESDTSDVADNDEHMNSYESLDSIEVDAQVTFAEAMNEDRNQKCIKIVHDRRDGKNILIGETDDFIVTFDVEKHGDTVYGKWEAEGDNDYCDDCKDAMNVLKKWSAVPCDHPALTTFQTIVQIRVAELRAGKLKMKDRDATDDSF